MAVVCGSKLGSRQKSTNLEGGSGVNRLLNDQRADFSRTGHSFVGRCDRADQSRIAGHGFGPRAWCR